MRQPAPEYLRGQVAAFLTAQWALGNDPGIRHGADRGRDVLMASLAADSEVTETDLRHSEHEESIGGLKIFGRC